MKKRTFIYLAILMLSTMQIVAQNYFMVDTVVKRDLTNSGIIISEQSFEYNTSGLQTQKVQYSYVGGNTYGSKKEWSYNSSTEYTDSVYFFNYDAANSTWTSSFKTLYPQYDTDGNLLEEVSSYYDTGNANWVFTQKVQYFYNAGVIDSLLRFYYDTPSSTWKNQSKTIYSYTSGLLTLKLSKIWDSANNLYVESTKQSYIYDTNNLLIEDIFEYYDINTSSWINSNKILNTYDATSPYNKLIEEIYYWDINNGVWQGNSKNIYTYDSYENVDSTKTFLFDLANNTWNSNASEISTGTYDNQVDRNSLIIPEEYSSYFSFLFNHKIDLLHKTSYNPSTNQQEDYQDWEFSYLPITIVGISENSDLVNIGVYPNPVNSFVNIKGAENLSDYKLIIYDMQGRQIFYRANQSKINVQTLSAGSYMYRIVAKEGVKTGILLKN